MGVGDDACNDKKAADVGTTLEPPLDTDGGGCGAPKGRCQQDAGTEASAVKDEPIR